MGELDDKELDEEEETTESGEEACRSITVCNKADVCAEGEPETAEVELEEVAREGEHEEKERVDEKVLTTA